MKKIAICKSSVFSPNFKLDKIYYYEYDNGVYSIIDDFSILFKFDKKWQTPFQDFLTLNQKRRYFMSSFMI